LAKNRWQLVPYCTELMEAIINPSINDSKDIPLDNQYLIINATFP